MRRFLVMSGGGEMQRQRKGEQGQIGANGGEGILTLKGGCEWGGGRLSGS